MKKMMIALIAMLTIAVSASAMSYEQARREALFLTDKMAYELNLTDAQYEAAYEINLDYLMGVTSRYDVFGTYWERRNFDLECILLAWQWDRFLAATYFYRPLYWDAGYWHFGVYAHYPRRDYFYFGRPHFYATYRGGHSWRHNGGRSFYEGRRDHYRLSGGGHERHSGMRDGWDRGDYRGSGSSSTRVTGGERGSYRNGGSRSIEGGNTSRSGRDAYSGSASRSGGTTSRDADYSGSSRRSGTTEGTRSSGSFGGSRSTGTYGGSRSTSTEGSRSSGSFGGSRSTVGSSSRSTGTTSSPSASSYSRSAGSSYSRSAGSSYSRSSVGSSMSRSAGSSMSRSSVGSSMSRSSAGSSMSRSAGSAGAGSRGGGSFGGGSRSRR